MFVVKIVSDLQQFVDVCGEDYLQVPDNLYHKHQ
jgi:cupin superfamily acireductone dioxygenase involved in methionine salvage